MYKLYHNGKTYCCVHDNGNSFFVIYGSASMYDDANTQYKTFDTLNRKKYLLDFLKVNGYREISVA